MTRSLIAAAVLVAAATFTAAAAAADGETPFPAPKVLQVFVAAQTVTPDRAVITQVAPGGTVVFRAYAVDAKTRKVMAAKDVKYFYVKIANQPNVKLRYNPQAPGATAKMPWSGTWTVPTTYAGGTVDFKILIKIDAKRYGQFVQLPVATSQLTVTATPTTTLTAPVGVGPSAAEAAKLDVALYVDSVNGTRPAGAAARPVGCTQTNVYKRGEQFVLRVWGSEIATAAVLSTENVDTATVTFTGVATPLNLSWGAHGATTNRVWFWTAPWNIPADYPLGDSVARINFKTDSGKVGTYDYAFTVIP
jgi:hypothetical protein